MSTSDRGLDLRGADWGFVAWAALVVAYFGLRALLSGPGQDGGAFGLQAALVVGGPSKLIAFVIATAYALRSAYSLGADTPTRGLWVALGLGFACFGLGQSTLVVHQLFIAGDTPTPSFADLGFVAGYGLMVTAAFGFVWQFARSGLLVIPRATMVGTAAAASVAVLAFLIPIELSIFAGDDPTGLKLVGATYPLLDAVLLVPTVLLTRIVQQLRGSVFARPWRRILAGFALFTLGDASYAVPVESWLLDPLLDGCFSLGYLLCAWGCYGQDRLLREPLGD